MTLDKFDQLNKKTIDSTSEVLWSHLFSVVGLFGKEQLLGSLLSWQANIVQSIV